MITLGSIQRYAVYLLSVLLEGDDEDDDETDSE